MRGEGRRGLPRSGSRDEPRVLCFFLALRIWAGPCMLGSGSGGAPPRKCGLTFACYCLCSALLQERIKAYAEAVRHENKQYVQNAPEKRIMPKPPSTRQKAIEFARQRVPKPKLKATALASEMSDDGNESEDEGMTMLQQLAIRHQRDKDLVSAIRKDLRIS